MTKCNLRDTKLIGAKISLGNNQTIFYKANFTRATFGTIIIEKSVDIRSARFNDSLINNAKLKGIDFTDVLLRDITINDSEISGAKFNGALFDGVYATRVEFNEACNFINMAMKDCFFKNTHMCGVNFEDVKISDCGFSNSDIKPSLNTGSGITIKDSSITSSSVNNMAIHIKTAQRILLESVEFINTIIKIDWCEEVTMRRCKLINTNIEYVSGLFCDECKFIPE